MLIKLKLIIQNIIKRLRTSHFIKNVLFVGGGIAISHGIVLIFMPFLTRLYGPDSFGIAAQFTSIIKIAAPVATLGYANAIVMPENDNDAIAIARLAILCGLLITLLSFIFIYFFYPWIAVWISFDEKSIILFLIPISLLVNSFLSVAEKTAIRGSFFKTKARAKVESTIITNISKLVGGVLAPSGILLIILTTLGQAINFIMQVIRIPRNGVFNPFNWFGVKGVLAVAVKYRDFCIYRLPQSILNSASTALPIILLSTIFNTSAAGQYSLAVMALGAPAMLIGQAIGEVFYPKITRAITAKTPKAKSLFVQATLILFLLGLFPFGIVFLWADNLFPLLFGHEWERAGEYAQWISLWLLAVLTTNASIVALPALRLQGFLLINEVISVCLRLAAFYVAFYYFQSDIMAVALFSIVNVIMNSSIILITFKRLSCLNKEWLSCQSH